MERKTKKNKMSLQEKFDESERLYLLAQSSMDEKFKEKLKLKSIQLLRQAAYRGHAGAQYYLGIHYENTGYFGSNPQKAVYWYKKAVKQKFAEAFNNLAHNYETGQGVKKNLAKAKLLYGLGAKYGDPIAKANLKVFEKQEKKRKMRLKKLKRKLASKNR